MNVPDYLSRHLRNAVACTSPHAVAVNASGVRAERQAVQRAGGTYLDVTPWLCTTSACPVVVDNLLAYRDDNHLSTPLFQLVGAAARLPARSDHGGNHKDATADREHTAGGLTASAEIPGRN